MIARMAEHSHLPAGLDPQYTDGVRTFLAARPGFCGGYHLLEADTGRALSLTLWQDEDALAAADRAMRDGVGPADGRMSRQTKPVVRIAQVAAIF